jgi:glutamate synthase (ferredoxin)
VDLMKIRYMHRPGFRVETISLLYYKGSRWKTRWSSCSSPATRPTASGANILILSDRGVDENHVAIPSLLAVSALEQYLVRTKKRTAVSLILESGEPRDVHHFATLLGYGAQAVNPYLAQECVAELVDIGMLDKDPTPPSTTTIRHPPRHREDRLQNGHLHHPVLPVGAQIFEAWASTRDVIDRYFTNTVSRVGASGLRRSARAWSGTTTRPSTRWASPRFHARFRGLPQAALRPRQGGPHVQSPDHPAAAEGGAGGRAMRGSSSTRPGGQRDKPHTLRGLLDFVPKNGPSRWRR